MFSWLRRSASPNDPQQAAELYGVVRSQLNDSDEESVTIVASVAAVLLCIAYADCDYDSHEEAVVRLTLERVHGIDAAGVSAIMTVLNSHTVRITGAEASTYARELLSLTEEDFRIELLDMLLLVAAADGAITVTETNILRDVTTSMGLSPAHYLEAQSAHRDKLAVLKKARA